MNLKTIASSAQSAWVVFRMSLSARLQKSWYGESVWPALKPFSFIFSLIVSARRWAYQQGFLISHRLHVPVIVVGNLTVGGTGKTPLTLWLADFLKRQGFRPGIVSRGYGGKSLSRPLIVEPSSQASLVGDEPLLMARRTGCPVAVFPRRVDAGKALLQAFDCDILISDDGLQHYALKRDVEIAVIDGARRFGNGMMLPAGPLREPVRRLQSVDIIVCQGQAAAGEYGFVLEGDMALNLKDETIVKPLAEFKGFKLNAVAGIGNPQRFFDFLRSFGLVLNERIYPDHHAYSPDDLSFDDGLPVLMTEKDAVKCRSFALENHWSVPIEARLPPEFESDLLKLLKEKYDGQKTA